MDPDSPALRFQLRQQRSRIYWQLDLDYALAESELEQIRVEQPRSDWATLFLAGIALHEGRRSEALELIANAEEMSVGGQQGIFLSWVALFRSFAGDHEAALKASTQALKLNQEGGPDTATALWVHSLILIHLERIDDATPFIDRDWELERSTKPEAFIYQFAKIGEVAGARSILTDSRYEVTNHFYLALVHLVLGDKDSTFGAIEAGIENHTQLLLASLLLAEFWNPIRDDPRFVEMLELLGSKVTHTEDYLRDHHIRNVNQP